MARYVANTGQLFPRLHPSANLSLLVGALAVIGAGPVAGVPGVLLSRLVLREVAQAPGLYTEGHRATIGFWAAWAGTILYSGAVLLLAGREVPAAACGALALGLIAVVAAAVLLQKRRSLAVALLGAIAVTSISSGVGGLVLHAGDVRAQAARCDQLRDEANSAARGGRFEEASVHVSQARGWCAGGRLEELESFERTLPGQEAEYQKQQVLARFEKTRGSASKLLATAKSLSASGDHRQADAKLIQAEADLNGYGHYPYLAADTHWKDALAAIRAERRRIAPEVDRQTREQLASLLKQARTLIATRSWTAASGKLAAAETLRKSWQPLQGSGAAWQTLNADLTTLRARVDKGVEAERRAAEAAAEAARKRREAQERAAEAAAAAREATRMVSCCDGTLSPSCRCNRGSYRGCCSHHGGVCGCE